LSGVVGIVLVFTMVFGGYLLAGGKMSIILAALPFELMIIGGSAVGAFLIANGFDLAKEAISQLKRVFRGAKWASKDYQDLMCLLFSLIRLSRQDPIMLEQHIEEPKESSIFGRYPKIQADFEATSIICDTMRSAAMNYNDPHQVEDVLEKRVDNWIAGAKI